MDSKTVLLDCLDEFIEKIDRDISELCEENYRQKVALNALISLLIKKGVLDEYDFKSEMGKVRAKVRDA